MRIAGEIEDFDPATVVSAKEARKLERCVTIAVGASREALTDSGLTDFDPDRVGIIFGSAIGGVIGIVEQWDVLRERRWDRMAPSFLPNVLVDTASGQIAISLGIKGLNYAIVSACATGSHAIGEAAEIIRRGDRDAMIAGGTEACVHPIILGGFRAMRGLVARTRIRSARRGRSTPRAPGSSCRRARARSSSRTGSTPSGAAPRSTPRCSATAARTTRTTSPSPSRTRSASRR